MAKQTIDIGVQGNDGTGDSIRESFRKVNENFNEIYAVFGVDGVIGLTDLGDTPLKAQNPALPISPTNPRTRPAYDPNQFIMANGLGSRLSARTMTAGAGISINYNSDDQLTISATVGELNDDTKPTLGAPLNSSGLALGNVGEPNTTNLNLYNNVHGTNLLTTDSFAIPKGYADNRYVIKEKNLTNNKFYLPDALRAREEPTSGQTSDPDYDGALTSNYLSTEVLPRKNVVYRGGDTMTGKLYLSDHPAPLAGAGIQTSADDLQAATKYYVDNNTFSSNVNLFVTTSGDDLQTKVPPGKEGRFWQYAYRSIGAAALAAENLITLASQEPGPYRQRIAYTIGPDQTFSTISSVQLVNGNSQSIPYQAAYNLLQANKTFIQAETIAYINNKYVNTFTYDKAKYNVDIQAAVEGVANDLVFDTTYNSFNAGARYFNEDSTKILPGQLTQTIEAIKFARDQVLGFAYSSTGLNSYIDVILDSVSYDLVFSSNYQSISAGHKFSSAGTALTTSQIEAVLNNLLGSTTTPNTILNIPDVVNSSSIQTTIKNSFATIINLIKNGTVPELFYGTVPATTTGQINAKTLLIENINFIQAELIAYLSSEYPNLPYDRVRYKADIDKIIKSLVFDFMYGGNKESVYVGNSYWNGATRTIEDIEVQPVVSMIGYINTLAQAIITNTSPAIVYQQTIRQYRNESLAGGGTVSTSITNNINSIVAIVNQHSVIAVVNPTIPAGTTANIRTAMTVTNATTYKTNANSFVDLTYPVISDSGVLTAINNKFQVIIDILTLGITNQNIQYPTYTNPNGAPTSAFDYARLGLQANLDFIAAEAVAKGEADNPTYTYGTLGTTLGRENVKRIVKRVISAISYDITYGTTTSNVATVDIAKQFWVNAASSWPAGVDRDYISDVLDKAQDLAIKCSTNVLETVLISPLTIITATITGTTLNSSTVTIVPPITGKFVVGNIITTSVSGSFGGLANNTTYFITGVTSTTITLATYNTGTNTVGAAFNASSTASGSLGITTNNTRVRQNNIAGNALASSASTTINDRFNTVKAILNSLTNVPTIVYPSDVGYNSTKLSAKTDIVASKTTVANDTIVFLDTTFTGGFAYDESLCYRDIGLIIDAMSIDLITGGTYQSIFAGKSYYKNSSAKAIAIGTQYSETLDGINFTYALAIQVLNKSSASRYQILVPQITSIVGTLPTTLIGITGVSGDYNTNSTAITTFSNNMDIMINIINNGIGAAPVSSFGTGIWKVSVTNGGTGAVDQGKAGNNDIIPAKIIVGFTSNAYASIVKYTPGNIGGTGSVDVIEVRKTKPGFFVTNSMGVGGVGEQIEFGETVQATNITIFVESGIYYEDYPIRLPNNVSIKGDEFRRTIIRPRDRISQSPWRKIFFYRDAVIDAMQIGLIDTSTNYANTSSITLDGTTNQIVITLGTGQVPSTWIGKILQVSYVDQGSTAIGESRVGKATIDSISGNFMNCSVIYPFYNKGTVASPNWKLYDGINYARHYLTNPLDVNSPAKNNKDIDVFLCNDAVRVNNVTIQGHGGFAMVLDPEGQIKTKSPYGQVCSSFSQSNNNKRFAGGQFVDGFAGRLKGFITNIVYDGIQSLNIQTAGSGYTPGIYTNVKLTGANSNVTGIGAVATITIGTAGVGTTITAATITSAGQGYKFADLLVIDTVGQTIPGLTNIAGGGVIGVQAVNGNGNGITVTIVGDANSGLDFRPPQPPCAFYVSGYRYQIDDIVSHDPTTRTVVVTMNVDTPYNALGSYNNVKCSRDVGYILDAVGYDIVTGSNYQSITAGLAYQRSSATNVVGGQKTSTIAGIQKARDLALLQTNTGYRSLLTLNNSSLVGGSNYAPASGIQTYPNVPLTPYTVSVKGTGATASIDVNNGVVTSVSVTLGGSNYKVGDILTASNASLGGSGTGFRITVASVSANNAIDTAIINRFDTITTILDQGINGSPAITYPTPSAGSDTNLNKARDILIANRTFIQNEITAYIADTFILKSYPAYKATTLQNYVVNVLNAFIYDIYYGGNSQTINVAESFYYRNLYVNPTTNTNLFGTNLESVYQSAFTRLKAILGNIVAGTSISITAGNTENQITTNAPSAGAILTAVQTKLNTLSDNVIDYVNDGQFTATTLSSVTCVGTSGQFTCTSSTLYLGQYVHVTGTLTGNVTGVTSGQTYYIIATNGTTSFTLSAIPNGQAITTSNSTTTGLVFNIRPVVTYPDVATGATGYAGVTYTYDTGLKTARTTIDTNKSTTQSSVISYLNNGADLLINIEMGGNKSMLANDFAMINDLGYAIVCTNGAVSEQVSTFTYYCHTHYWSNNGGQIRSVAGSNAHGTYGLRASGYDVTEVPDAVSLANNMIQTARVYKQGIFGNEMTPTATQQALFVYITDYSYNPMGSSELEIDHSIADSTVGIVRYEVKSVEYTTVSINGKSVLKLNLSTTGNSGTSSTGLARALYNGQQITIRTLTKNKFNGIANVNPTRPSTALQYNEDLADIYRILAYGLADSTGEILPSNVAILESDSSFDYYKFIVDVSNIVKPDPAITPVTATINAGASVSSTTITVSNATGSITQGMGVWIESGGINTGQFVVSATGGGGNWTVVLSKPPSSVPTTNAVITFSTKTQGSLPGDDKVSVLEVTQSSIINQINKGIYIVGWGGRVFRVKEYVVPQFIASANTFVDWGIVGTNKLRVQVVTGNIEIGDIIKYTSGGNLVQFVDSGSNPITVTNVTSGLVGGVLTYEVTFSATPTVLPSVGNAPFVFGVAYTGYLRLDPNAIDNNSSEGNSISALTYTSSVAGTSSGSRIVTFDIPFGNTVNGSVLPVVDSYVNIQGNTLATPYNGYYQISGVTDQTVVAVPSVDGLVVGMIVSSAAPSAIVPPSTIIQSIDPISKTITVSPSCWIPSGTTITATIYAYITSIAGSLPTTTFADPSLLEVRIGTVTTGGTAGTVVQGRVKANTQITAGNVYTITGWTIISPGFGYTSAPSVKLFYNNVEVTTALTAVMSATATNAVTSTGGITTRNISIYYPRDPGVTGNLVQVANSGNIITLDSVTGLDVNNRIIFYKTATGSDIGNIVTGVTYYIKTIDGPNKNITVSATISNGVAGTVFVPVNSGTLSGTMTYHSPDYGVPTTVTINSAAAPVASTTINGTVSYLVTFTLGANFTSTLGNWYYISNSSNSLYNGFYQATATNTNNTTLVVRYPSNPGTFAGTASVYYDPTNATTNKRGLGIPFNTSTSSTLRLGYPADTTGQITVRISTCRASGHDFLDIGTGSYSTTNYPYTIYGNPAQSRQPQNEVKEDGVGRVFYVTTDQNGIFRVGRFFTVDQGTGTVTFSASIALSNLDGLGFKRGVVVSEFSTDSSMTNNAPDTVSTQSAVRGYIDKRLGLDHSGGVLPVSNLIGPGFMALNGALSMKGNMVMGAFKITQLGTPTENADATTKDYVDSQIAAFDQFRELRDTEFVNPANGQIAVYDNQTQVTITNAQGTGTVSTLWFNIQASAPFAVGSIIVVSGVGAGSGSASYNGEKIVLTCSTTTVTFVGTASTTLSGLSGTATATKWRNVTLPSDSNTSDVLLTYNSATGVFTSAIQNNKITNAMVSTTAAIVQSKLSMTVASARAVDGGTGTGGAIVQADLGLSTFNSSEFTVNAQGWVQLKTNGIAFSKIEQVAKDTVLGNKTNTALTDATGVTMSDVVKNGNGLQNSLFTSAGVLVLSTATNGANEAGTTLTGYANTYTTLGYTTTRESSKLLQTDTNGGIDVAYLKVDDKKVIDLDATATTVEFYTPGTYNFATATGTDENNTTVTVKGNLSVIDTNSKITVKQLTSGAATGTGSAATLTGQWTLSADSSLDLAANNNVLKVKSITTGDESTTGQITGRWSLVGSSTLQATYADLAEYYEGDQEYEPGSVLVFGGDKEVTTTKTINDTRAAGVVTTNPAYIMNTDQKGQKVCLALAGRVPCKVVGRVKKGDMLTTSATPGYAVKALNPTLGSIIGKALEDKDYGEAGVIQIAVGRL